ncbi:MAG: hypothetical protein ACKOBT_13715 [Actinomycetota bacterium]
MTSSEQRGFLSDGMKRSITTTTTSWSALACGTAVAGGAHPYRPGMWFSANSSFTAVTNAVASTTCAAGTVNGTKKRSPQRLGESLT